MIKNYRKTIGVSVLFIVFCLGIILFKKTTAYVAYPFLVVQQKITTLIERHRYNRKTVADLSLSIERMSKEREELIGQISYLRASIDYLDELEELIDFKQRYDQGSGVLAQVLLKNISEQEHFFLVDAGSRAGIQVDMPVVYNNCLIGKVQEVHALYSKVLMITDRSCKVAAYCSDTGTQGIYHGSNLLSGGMLDHVSHLSHLEENDLLFSSGQGLVFPRGFAIGRVKRYERSDLLYTVWVEPLLALEAISYVLILPLKVDSEYS